MSKNFIDALLETKDFKNSLYSILKHSFLYHSNKIEGSTFTTEALALLLDKNVVTGKHTLDDVQETVNSSYVFDRIVETLGKKIDDQFLKDLHARLMFNTTMHQRGYAGVYKTIPNMIIGTKVKIAQPFEVQSRLDELLEWYYSLDKITLSDIASFHYKFEIIHPFQDGNGRIGRFLMLKQMLENNLSIKIVSWDSEDLYRESLNLCDLDNQEPLSKYLETLEDFREEYKELWESM
ncbi:Fic family protein [Romboutsia lituseburensis]|uniref:Fic/DOC family protein n=1 Tax=Romboutsia lituseburensis DSM 797 TaxID=1121325 RepID=A0A1G9TGE6_9FIRM|nr:Fic family protein [Romboutsia lituseburensis]CEH36202.1 Fic protein [Romboutsia lituseburensis]SDM46869.1 Fic/DOC family protein [Romboutsia lituseburensis DSM 797]